MKNSFSNLESLMRFQILSFIITVSNTHSLYTLRLRFKVTLICNESTLESIHPNPCTRTITSPAWALIWKWTGRKQIKSQNFHSSIENGKPNFAQYVFTCQYVFIRLLCISVLWRRHIISHISLCIIFEEGLLGL